MKHCHLYFTAKPLSVESLVLKLCVKMLLANQIAGFFEVQYLKKKVRDQVDFLYQINTEVSYKEILLCWHG